MENIIPNENNPNNGLTDTKSAYQENNSNATLRDMLSVGHKITLTATQDIKRFSMGAFEVINRSIQSNLPIIVKESSESVAQLFKNQSGDNIVGEMGKGITNYFGEIGYNSLPPIMKDALNGWKKLRESGEQSQNQNEISSSIDETSDDDYTQISSQLKDGVKEELSKVIKDTTLLSNIVDMMGNSSKFENALLQEFKKSSESPEKIEEVLNGIKSRLEEKEPVETFRDKEKEETYRAESLAAMDRIVNALKDKAALQSSEQKNWNASQQNGSLLGSVSGFGLDFFGNKLKNSRMGRAFSRVAERVKGAKERIMKRTSPTKPSTQPEIKSQIKPDTKSIDTTSAKKQIADVKSPSKTSPIPDAKSSAVKMEPPKTADVAKNIAEEVKPKGVSKFLGKIGKIAKGGLKSLPFLGGAIAMIGGGTELASIYNDENLSEDDKKSEMIKASGGMAGSTTGSLLGGVIGAMGGPIGVALGSAIGGYLGDIIGRKGGEVIAETSADEYEDTIKKAKNAPERTDGLDLTSALDLPEVEDALDNQAFMLKKKDDIKLSSQAQEEKMMVPISKNPDVEKRNNDIRKYPTTSASVAGDKKEASPQVINNTPVTNVTNNYVNQGGAGQGQRDRGSIVVPMPINVASGNGFGMMTR